MTKKTWADLKHGDVIQAGNAKRTVIDVLPNSASFTKFFKGEAPAVWISFSDLEEGGWQIVQPEEEYIIEREIFIDPNCKKPEVELYNGVWRVRVYRKRSFN